MSVYACGCAYKGVRWFRERLRPATHTSKAAHKQRRPQTAIAVGSFVAVVVGRSSGEETERRRSDTLSSYDVPGVPQVYDQHGFPLVWEEGDVAIVCNYRFAHGRPNFELEDGEQRELGVVLGEMYDRVGALPGKWTA